MTEGVKVPDFAPELNLEQLQQTGFRASESWGRWLLGQRATLSFNSPIEQRAELVFKASVPYKGQVITVELNDTTLLGLKRHADLAGPMAGRIPVVLRAGQNTLEIKTNKSNLASTNPPFAGNDQTDISVAFNTLELVPFQATGDELYGFQPSVFLSPVYTSAGPQGLEILFEQTNRQVLNYSLLRRFQHQAFDFYLDGQLLHSIAATSPGHLLVGHLPVPTTPLPPAGLHTLRIEAKTSGDPHLNVTDLPILTTASDSSDVMFYVQRLELHTVAQSNNLDFIFGVVLLLALLIGLLWRLLFKPVDQINSS